MILWFCVSGFTGEKGFQGPRGMKGSVGVEGNLGEKGDIGPAGPRGMMVCLTLTNTFLYSLIHRVSTLSHHSNVPWSLETKQGRTAQITSYSEHMLEVSRGDTSHFKARHSPSSPLFTSQEEETCLSCQHSHSSDHLRPDWLKISGGRKRCWLFLVLC